METRLNCPDSLTRNAVTETILTSEMIIGRPGLTERPDCIDSWHSPGKADACD